MSEQDAAALEARIEALQSELDFYKKQVVESHQMIAVGQLLAGIVHEINTPIGAILTNNEVTSRALVMLKEITEKARAEQSPPPPKTTKLLATLVNVASVDKLACERIAAVVRSLKTFVGGHTADCCEANINEIVDNTLKLAHCEFRKRVTVDTDYGELPEVECDPHQMGQVFLNILVNAGQAIEGEGKVSVATRREGDYVVVSIADTGSGIPEENRGRIFTSGFTTKEAGVGTGLGLAISHDIVVNRHNGKIDFESEAGKGTTFYVRIPVPKGAASGE